MKPWNMPGKVGINTEYVLVEGGNYWYSLEMWVGSSCTGNWSPISIQLSLGIHWSFRTNWLGSALKNGQGEKSQKPKPGSAGLFEDTSKVFVPPPAHTLTITGLRVVWDAGSVKVKQYFVSLGFSLLMSFPWVNHLFYFQKNRLRPTFWRLPIYR